MPRKRTIKLEDSTIGRFHILSYNDKKGKYNCINMITGKKELYTASILDVVKKVYQKNLNEIEQVNEFKKQNNITEEPTRRIGNQKTNYAGKMFGKMYVEKYDGYDLDILVGFYSCKNVINGKIFRLRTHNLPLYETRWQKLVNEIKKINDYKAKHSLT